MKSDALLSDVLSLGNPKILQPIVIDDILKKYIYVGMPKKDAIAVFKNEGFETYEKDVQNSAQKILIAYYAVPTEEVFIDIPIYKIIADIPLIDGKVSEFSGVYLKGK